MRLSPCIVHVLLPACALQLCLCLLIRRGFRGQHTSSQITDACRFPVNDPGKQPVVTPRPGVHLPVCSCPGSTILIGAVHAEDDAVFLQALLEGIADVEMQAYQRLADMGATPLKQVQLAVPSMCAQSCLPGLASKRSNIARSCLSLPHCCCACVHGWRRGKECSVEPDQGWQAGSPSGDLSADRGLIWSSTASLARSQEQAVICV